MFKVNQYALHPGACYFCRQPRLPAIDTLMDEETPVSNTRIYICGIHVMQMAAMVAADMGKEIVDKGTTAGLVMRADEAERKSREALSTADMFRATLAGIADATKEKFGVTIEEATAAAEELVDEELGR